MVSAVLTRPYGHDISCPYDHSALRSSAPRRVTPPSGHPIGPYRSNALRFALERFFKRRASSADRKTLRDRRSTPSHRPRIARTLSALRSSASLSVERRAQSAKPSAIDAVPHPIGPVSLERFTLCARSLRGVGRRRARRREAEQSGG